MIRLLRAEAAKLNGSLALLLMVAAPAFPGVIAALATLFGRRVPSWESTLLNFALTLWAAFLLPMTVAAFAALLGQIEHRARGWDQLYAMPLPRWQVIAAKIVTMVVAVMAMTLLMLLFTSAGAAVGGGLRGEMPGGAIPWDQLARRVPALVAASLFLTMLLLWTSLRFASFVAPLLVGIGGVMVALAVAISGTDQADWFPWVITSRAMRDAGMQQAVTIGLVGAAVTAVVMVATLVRRDVR